VLGVGFILLSLVMDGVTGGIQKKLKTDMSRIGLSPKPYDFMYYTNLSMAVVALGISLLLGEFMDGWNFCRQHPAVMQLVLQFSVCSAIGQSFIFYTVAHFDPLVCSTVTTTRKIFSVLLSLVLKGHALTIQGWAGVSLAIGGIISEVHHKVMRTRHLKSKVSM
jgi:UDP-galactose transporter B1